MRYRCGDCKGSLDKLRSAPMVHNEVWQAVARDVRLLCDHCFRQRMRRVLGRPLRFDDLKVVRFNVWTGHCHELTAPGQSRIAFAHGVHAWERANDEAIRERAKDFEDAAE